MFVCKICQKRVSGTLEVDFMWVLGFQPWSSEESAESSFQLSNRRILKAYSNAQLKIT